MLIDSEVVGVMINWSDTKEGRWRDRRGEKKPNVRRSFEHFDSIYATTFYLVDLCILLSTNVSTAHANHVVEKPGNIILFTKIFLK